MKQHQQALSGDRVVVPESRELDRFSAMLERHGATVLRSPLILVSPLQDTSTLDAWLDRLIAGRHDTLVFYTGEGVTHIVARAEELGRRDQALAAFAATRKIARGPKPGAALRKLGLSADIVAEAPTTEGLLATLEKLAPHGQCVAVQLYPGAPADRLGDALKALGAGFDPVLPYRYISDEVDDEVASVIRAMASGDIDLIAFTSKLQVQRLCDVAKRQGLEAELEQAFAATTIAAVGPVAAAAVEEAGGTVRIQPTSSFHLKPLVTEIVRTRGER
ncbi:uroporphyrinogen-III synthase [Altericroceibacterium xinjiangense]|uniref:uroporphyrinogen-III synthase n=1 Tax=Altericroceibacterium xinjiangense TaxID=762261 RepID=UPI000F7D9DDA|nr:uroporphyrinogen-III synthase [Altericroceibacterium xinjiangense]